MIPFVGVARPKEGQAPLGDFVIVLDNLQDHGNIGTIKDTATFGDELEALLTPLFEGDYIRHAGEAMDAIQLTDKGNALLAQLWSVVEATEDEVLGDFTADEKRRFREYLRRVQDNCQRIMREP